MNECLTYNFYKINHKEILNENVHLLEFVNTKVKIEIKYNSLYLN
jgi:hypothetical protein